MFLEILPCTRILVITKMTPLCVKIGGGTTGGKTERGTLLILSYFSSYLSAWAVSFQNTTLLLSFVICVLILSLMDKHGDFPHPIHELVRAIGDDGEARSKAREKKTRIGGREVVGPGDEVRLRQGCGVE